MQLLPLDAPMFKAPESAVYKFADLPIKPIDPTASKKLSYTCVVEVVDLPEKPDVDVIHQRLTSCESSGVEPWTFLQALPAHQYVWAVYHHEDGHWQILRLLHFPKRVLGTALNCCCRGKIMTLDSKNSKMPSATQYIMMNLDGVSELIINRDMVVPEAPKEGTRTLTRAQISGAIDYINRHGKTGLGNNEAMRWAWCEMSDPTSPLFCLPISFIREGLNNKKSVVTLAKLVEECPLTLHDLTPWALREIVKPLCSIIRSKSMVVSGLSEI
eukprot:4735244-Amphidinium_carterae.1